MYEELEPYIKKYHELSESKKKLENEMKQLRSTILDSLPANVKVEIGGFDVSVNQHTRRSVDTEALKIVLGDKYDSYLKESTSTRLTVKKL